MVYEHNPNFNLYSRYNAETGIEAVRFGADAQVLESELNELQQVASSKIQSALKELFTDGLSNINCLSYEPPTFKIEDVTVLINGNLIYVSKLELNLNEGPIYIETWVDEVDYDDTLKKYGNVQETNTIDNWIIDDDFGRETSRRMQRKYGITSTPTKGDFLKIGKIRGGEFVREVKSIGSKVSKNSTKEVFTSDGQNTVYTLKNGEYTPNAEEIDIYVNGILIPKAAYTETSINTVTLKSPAPVGANITIVYG